MCVAAIIHTPVTLSELTQMEESNPHGGGVAWVEGTEIRFIRGLDAATIFKLQTEGVLGFPYMLHFRWATHGEVVSELTHPFPVGPRAAFGELTGTAPSVMMHNGTWNGQISYEGRIEYPDGLLDALSDTAFAAIILGTLSEGSKERTLFLKSISWATATWEMTPTGLTQEFHGTWYPYGGNSYSNLTWRSSYWTYRSKTVTGGWSWGDGEADEPTIPFSGSAGTVTEGGKEFTFDDWLDWRYGAEQAPDEMARTDDELEEEIEEAIKMARPGFHLPSDRVLELLDRMNEDQWCRYTARRTGEHEVEGEDWFDVVSDDGELVNQILGRRAG